MKILKIRDVKTPTRANMYDAGIDFFIPNDYTGKTILQPNESVLIPSGIKVNIPNGYMLTAFNKSGIASKQNLLVGACVIDETLIETNKGRFTAITLNKDFVKNNNILIKGYNIEENIFDFYEFDGFRISGNKEVIKLTFDNDTDLICTEDHMLLTKNRGWIQASLLNETDILITN